MNEAILFHIDGKWLLFDENTVRAVQEYPRLEIPVIVLTDFGGALSGVSSVDAGSDYAEALINRQLRDEGLIDGEAKVIAHRCAKNSGTHQALYTAVPTDAWQRMQTWARLQKESCLLIPQMSVMRQLLQRGNNGVIFRCGRRISLLLQQQGVMNYFSVLSLSDNTEDLLASVRTLAKRIPTQELDIVHENTKSTWFSLSASGEPDEDDALCKTFSEVSGIETARAPTKLYKSATGNCHVALSALEPFFSERSAVNPVQARFNYFAEKKLTQAGWCAGFVAAAFVLGGFVSFWQAFQINARTEQNRERASAIRQSAQGNEAIRPLAKKFYATRDLVDSIAKAQAGIDPYVFLKNLRVSAGDKVKILRVYLGKENIIEGWVDQVGGDDRPLAAFVAQLRQMGFSPVAIDASSSTTSTRRSGFFAYRLSEVSKQGDGL